MSASILPDASSWVNLNPSGAPSFTGACSWGGEIYFDTNSANGQYEVPIELHNVGGTGFIYFEIFRTPPNDGTPNHLFVTWLDGSGVQHVVDLGNAATLYGHWIHFAWTQSGGAPNVGHFYAALEGYNQSSPTYLASPNIGNVTVAANRITVGTELTDPTTVCLTTSIARMWATETELSESEVSGPGGIWTQYAATAAVSAHDYLFLTCTNPASPGDDTGNPGTDWTVTGTWSAGHSPVPSEWIASPSQDALFLGNVSLL